MSTKFIYVSRGLIILLIVLGFGGCGAFTQQYIPAPITKELSNQKARIIMKRSSHGTSSQPLSSCNYQIKYNNITVGTVAIGDKLVWDINAGNIVFSATKTTLCGGRNFSTKNYILKGGVTYTFLFTAGFDFNKGTIKLISNDEKKQIEKKETLAIVNKRDIAKKEQKTINNYISNKNFQGLKSYTDKHPNSVYYIQDSSIRLAFTGPKGLKVGDIRKYIKNGKSELILISMIKQQEIPYKKFTMDEIDILLKMELSDRIISAMIDVTTKLYDNKRVREQQEFFLNEQKKIANQTIQNNYQNKKLDTQGNPIVNKIEDEVIQQGVKLLLDQLF